MEQSLNERILSAALSGQLDTLQNVLEPEPHSVLRTANLTLEKICGAAARARQHEIVSYCVTLGVDLDNWDVLKGVLNGNSLEVYKVVIPAGFDINHDFDWVGDAIIYAAALDDVPLATYLLDHGAKPDLHLQAGAYSALAVAAKKAGPDMLSLLVSRGAKIDGCGAILFAAAQGRSDIVHHLIQLGADVEVMSNRNSMDHPSKEDQGTALHIAASEGHMDIVVLLLEHGASPSLRDPLGRIPLMRAQGVGHVDIVAVLKTRSS